MKFNNCSQLTLEGFTCGHTDGAGFCTGAVLHMLGCRDMSVTGCDLYGCGTYGLELDKCRGVHALGTTIRDCSYGALVANASADILLDNCSVYGIEGYGGIFSYSGCRDCAVINTLVRSCGSSSLMELNTAQDLLHGAAVRSAATTSTACSSAPLPAGPWRAASLRTTAANTAGIDEQWQHERARCRSRRAKRIRRRGAGGLTLHLEETVWTASGSSRSPLPPRKVRGRHDPRSQCG